MPVLDLQIPRSDPTTWFGFQKRFRIGAQLLGRDQDFVKRCLSYARVLHARGVPVIFDQDHLSLSIGVSLFYLRNASNSPKSFYREFEIPKRSGALRSIHEPLPTLKRTQRWITDQILNRVAVSRYSKAYIPGSRIHEHARFHCGQGVLLLMDIEDFFPSISPTSVYYVFRDLGYSRSVSGLLTGLCMLEEGLPQGAPTSPQLSNLVCRRLDARLGGFCIPKGIRYSRYADDLAFSGNYEPLELISFVSRVLTDEGFRANNDKTCVLRPSQRQIVGGLVVNKRPQVPRSVRREIRKQMYYLRKFGVASHMAYCNENRSGLLHHLLGKVSYVLQTRPRCDEFRNYKALLQEWLRDD